MKRSFCIMIVCFCLAACSTRKQPGEFTQTRILSEKYLQSFDTTDMNGDGEDELLLKMSTIGYNCVTIADENASVYSQVNVHGDIRYFAAMDVDHCGNKDLFISSIEDSISIELRYCDYTWHTPLERKDTMVMQMNRRNLYPQFSQFRWFGFLQPRYCTDIDIDGREEFVITGYSGFMCYPRGLWVIDKESYEVQWNYNIAGTIRDCFVEDVDGDGDCEIIITTTAYKNNPEQVNHTDDNHTYIMMFDAKGNLLDSIEASTGYSDLRAYYCDLDNDGTDELITAKLTWNNNNEKAGIYVYSCADRKFKLKQKHEVEGQYYRYGNFLVDDINSDGASELFVINQHREIEVFNNRLELVTVLNDHSFHFIFCVNDLDVDGNKELLTTTSEGELFAYNKHYEVIASLTGEELNKRGIKIRNTGYAKPKEILIQHDEQIRCFSFNSHSTQIKATEYAQFILLIVISIIVLGLILIRIRQIILFSRLLKAAPIGAATLSSKGKVYWANNEFYKLILNNDTQRLKIPEVEKIIHVGKSIKNCFITKKTIQLNQSGEMEATISMISRFPRVYSIIVTNNIFNSVQKRKLYWADVARGVSHGIRKHVNNIMLANQQLEMIHDTKTKSLTKIMQQEAEKLDYFIRSFQRFSELDDLTLLPTDAKSVIMHAMDTHTFPSTIKTSIQCESDTPTVSADAIRLEEVIHDLLDNAIEACEDKGVITVHVDRCETPERGSGVIVTIMDTGIGIEPDILPYITKPYFTTKPDGTGIGIPMALKTIESFSGTLEISSKPKLGTTITIFLWGVSNEKNTTG